MKRLILFFGLLIILYYPINVEASFLPPVLPSNTNTVVDFIVSSAMTDLAQNGVRVVSKDAFDTLNNILNGHSILSSATPSYVDLSNATWLNSTLWRSDGTSVLPQDAYMSLVQTDAGSATAIYAKDDAEMLLIGDTWESAESSLISGILGNNQTHRFPLTEPVLLQRNSNNGVFTSPTLTQEVKDEFESYAFSGYARSTDFGWICFVPNCCTVNTRILPWNNQYTFSWKGSYYPDGRVFNVVTNDPSEVYFTGNTSNFGYLNKTNNTYDGVTYTYQSGWYNALNPFWNGGEIYFHCPTNAEYNSLKNSEVVYTEPVTNTNETVNNYYSYSTYSNTYPTYTSTINNNYDYTSDISSENYPKNNSVNIPNYSPTYNYYENYYEFHNQPNVGEDIGTLDPNEITNGLPILNNLSKRFPFSIPWDIYNILSSLSAERETPYIDTYVTIPAVDYVWHIDYDLSEFDDIASLFRKLFLISFIVGLAWFSYDHFFGE